MEKIMFDRWWRSHQSSAHKDLRTFRFCIVSGKDERESSIKHSMGRKIDMFQKFTEIQKLGLNWWWVNWIRVEYLPRIHLRAAQSQSSRDVVKIERNLREILQDGSSSCRCFTTSHGDRKTTRKNTSQVLNSFLYLQKDSEQDNDHSSDLDQIKSCILSMKIVHKVNGTKWRKRWWWHSQKADIQSFESRVNCPEECPKAKAVENCRSTVVPIRKRLQLFFAQLLL